MFAGCHIGSGIGQRQRLNPLQDMKPIGVIGCCASEQDNESTGFSDLSNVVTVNWQKLVSCLEGCRLWVLDQAELAPQPMPAAPEPDSVSALVRHRT